MKKDKEVVYLTTGMKAIPILLVYLVLAGAKEPTYGTLKAARLVRVIDGDTFLVQLGTAVPPLFRDSVPVRVYGIDTPELHAPDSATRAIAWRARMFTDSALICAKRITLLNVRRDKYFRILADVRADTLNLGPALIARHLAKAYFGGTKNP